MSEFQRLSSPEPATKHLRVSHNDIGIFIHLQKHDFITTDTNQFHLIQERFLTAPTYK